MAMEFTLGGKPWWWVRPRKPNRFMGKCDGVAVIKRDGSGTIYIRHYDHMRSSECFPSVDKRELYLILHESLHAQDWSKSERQVERDSQELTDLLWTLGYRRNA